MGLRVKDIGESESRFVIKRIGMVSHAKAGRLPNRSLITREFDNPLQIGKQMAVMKQLALSRPTAKCNSSTDAPIHITNGWHDIDWYDVTRNVRRLQARNRGR